MATRIPVVAAEPMAASSYTYIGSSAVDGSGNCSFNLAPGSYKLFLAPVSSGFGMQWFGGTDYASAATITVSGNTTQDIAL